MEKIHRKQRYEIIDFVYEKIFGDKLPEISKEEDLRNSIQSCLIDL